MNWDWDKLKQRQQGAGRGGMQPGVDALVKKFKKFKNTCQVIY